MVANSKVRYRTRDCKSPAMLERLEDRTLLSVAVTPIPTETLPQGKTLLMPVTGSNTLGSSLNYSVSSSDPAVTAQVLTGNTWLTLNLSYDGGTTGTMVLELFNDLTPMTVGKITTLVNQGFYNNLIFHRVISGFVMQGGDPNGDGTGGPGFQFDDEFNTNEIFSGDGQLAMANSGKDTNGSQFFVTTGAQRALDFNYTIFGQLVRGFDVRDAILATPVDANSKPLQAVTITSATISSAPTTDAVLLLTSTGALTNATVTVTANDGNGNSAQQQFSAQPQTDTVNDPPILGPVGNQVTTPGTPVTFSLTSADLENDPVYYNAAEVVPSGGTAHSTVTVSGNQITVTPLAGYVGDISVIVGVAQTGATGRGSSTSSPYDTQVITVTSNALPTGWVDSISGNSISGWVWDQNAGATSTQARIVVDGSTLATITANQPRGDLTNTFIGSPLHGFTYTLPQALSFGTHSVTVYAIDSTTGQAVAVGSGTFETRPAMFDETWYLAHNPDVNAAVAAGWMPSGWYHYLHYGEQEGRSPSAYFDETYYRAANPDVALAIVLGQFKSGFEHFIEYGQSEPARNPNQYFNESYYLTHNPDVAAAVSGGAFASGYQHFLEYGSLENRVPSTLFNPVAYLVKNPDVAAAVSAGYIRSAWDHYMVYGRFEGRIAT